MKDMLEILIRILLGSPLERIVDIPIDVLVTENACLTDAVFVSFKGRDCTDLGPTFPVSTFL